jgi:hypothetical protein
MKIIVFWNMTLYVLAERIGGQPQLSHAAFLAVAQVLAVSISQCPLPASVFLACVGYTDLPARRTKTFKRE